MLYVFYGTDEEKARAKVRATINALEKKAPDAHTARITDEDVAGVNVEILLAAQGLFYAKRIVVFDKALSRKNVRAHVVSRFKDMAASEHVFLVLEGAVDAELEKQCKKHATKIELFGDVKKEKEKDGADWGVTNAFEAKNGKVLWVALQKARIQNTAPEQIHGQLFWKAKQLMLAGRFGRYKEREVKNMIGELAALPHEARRRGVELEYALEKFALELV